MGNEYQRFLMHHGIKGQKWGERNGPPYPLKPSQRSAGERKAAGENSEGGALAALALSAFALTVTAVKVAPTVIKERQMKKKNKNILDEAEKISNDKKYASERENEEIDPETGLYLTGKKMSAEENMERINPSFDSGNEMFKINCTACTMAMELRERGYDVHAGTDGEKMLRNHGTYTADRKANWYTGENNPYESSKYYDFDEEQGQDGVKQFRSDISKEPNTRGEICTRWKFDGGHSMYYKTDKKGKLSVYDAQVGKKYSDAELDEIFSDSYGITVTRLDKSTPNIQYLKDNNYIR